MEVFVLKAIEIGGYGEGDFVVGAFSSVATAEDGWDEFLKLDPSNDERYAMCIASYVLDRLYQ
jgi:hypothetical protein